MRSWVAGAMVLCLTGCVSDRTTVVSVNQLNNNQINNNAGAAPAASPLRPGPLVGHELRKIRMAEEMAIISRTGHPQPLPTGACSIIVTLAPGGMLAGTPVMQCDNPVLAPDMTKAVAAAAPFPAPANVTQLHLFIRAEDMEPGVGTPS